MENMGSDVCKKEENNVFFTEERKTKPHVNGLMQDRSFISFDH